MKKYNIIKDNVISVAITASINNSKISSSVKVSAPEITAMAKYNEETLKSIENIEKGKNLSKRFTSVEELMEDLNA